MRRGLILLGWALWVGHATGPLYPTGQHFAAWADCERATREYREAVAIYYGPMFGGTVVPVKPSLSVCVPDKREG